MMLKFNNTNFSIGLLFKKIIVILYLRLFIIKKIFIAQKLNKNINFFYL